MMSFAATLFCVVLALVRLFRRRRSIAGWSFAAAMACFAAESALYGYSLRAVRADRVGLYAQLALMAKSFEPGLWLIFSLTFSRGNPREFLARARWLVAAVLLFPTAVALGLSHSLISAVDLRGGPGLWWVQFGWPAKALSIFTLCSSVLILMNLESTFRAAVGTMRWQIKFMVLGLAVVFGSRIYTGTQEVLFSGYGLGLNAINSLGLLIGCVFMTVAYWRTGFTEIDVYPSQAVLRTSLTLLLVGGYLFVVGILAQLVTALGGVDSFQAQATLVLLAVSGLGVLLLSDRLRQELKVFVGRHFRKARHDSLTVWTQTSRAMAMSNGQRDLCTSFIQLASRTFQALSVTLWVVREPAGELVFVAGTVRGEAPDSGQATVRLPASVEPELGAAPFDLEGATGPAAETLRGLTHGEFPNGGARLCLPVVSGAHRLAFVILADRVNGAAYTEEELELLRCMGEQLGSGLLNLRLTEALVHGKELEAFQTMSAFFVHDLKNAASTLTLMLQNLPIHFDDPGFRQDALRGIGNTLTRINQLVEGLSLFRGRLKLETTTLDLNNLVAESLSSIPAVEGVSLEKDFQPLSPVRVDRAQMQGVIVNLLHNAREALAGHGCITVRTREEKGYVTLAVADTGCGISPAFLRDSLFRPFQTTKKKGLGIGMFQTRTIVEAHGGTIQVESKVGAGTTFRISLPAGGIAA